MRDVDMHVVGWGSRKAGTAGEGARAGSGAVACATGIDVGFARAGLRSEGRAALFGISRVCGAGKSWSLGSGLWGA
ncbi:hypothetical protein LIER_32602 [Lithospermum erythrorhizon]|uniref:Uncharacterized protein n=1 Tax=Lithospermum erythrorhizon TaxID=34254 RepID=A0AAV3RXY6_LITER